MKIRNDLTGNRYGRLTAIKCVGIDENHHSQWLCKCDCGNEKVVLGNSLVTGRTRSCGCLYTDTRHTASKTHGLSRTRLFHIWAAMQSRCRNENNRDWRYYGGKGVTVCEEWKDFCVFAEWAHRNGYKEDLTIDRIDVSKGYSPDNCRWADAITQMNNTTRNRYIEFNGETRTLEMWSREVGIPARLIRQRLEHGWSTERALTTPKK